MRKEEIFQGAGLDYLFRRLFKVTEKLTVLNLDVSKKHGAYDDIFFMRYFSNFRLARGDYLKNLYNKHGLIDLKFVIQFFNISDLIFSFLGDNFEFNILLTLLQPNFCGLQNLAYSYLQFFQSYHFFEASIKYNSE